MHHLQFQKLEPVSNAGKVTGAMAGMFTHLLVTATMERDGSSFTVEVPLGEVLTAIQDKGIRVE